MGRCKLGAAQNHGVFAGGHLLPLVTFEQVENELVEGIMLTHGFGNDEYKENKLKHWALKGPKSAGFDRVKTSHQGISFE